MKRLQILLEQRTTLREQRDAIEAAAEQRAGDNPDNARMTPEEWTQYRSIIDQLDPLDAEIDAVSAQELRDANAAKAALVLGVTRSGGAVVRREPMTYERHNRGVSYFRDLGLAFVGGDQDARGRLAQHRREMEIELPKREERLESAFQRALDDLAVGDHRATVQRDITRVDGAGGEFVPPLWLIDQYGDFARAGRPFADMCRTIPLPGGTDSISVPRITGGAAVAAQTADNAAVQETDIQSSSATGPVRTLAGQQDIALQLLEQSPIMFDEIIYADLLADYNAKLDVQLINGTGSNGQHTGALVLSGTNATTYTDASPTVPELYPAGAQTLSLVASNRKLPANVWFMHPRRWYWMLGALDGNSRPYVLPVANGAYNALGVQTDPLAEGPVGVWHGVPVRLDANMPTALGGGTEDAIIGARMMDLLLFEGAIKTRALPEVLSGTLTVRLQVYAYSAYIPGRQPYAIGKITGTGLAAPAGY